MMNVCLTERGLEGVYQNLFKIANDLIQKYNPCDPQNGMCSRHREHGGENFCCDRCKHLTPEGCDTQSLACKMWLCGYAADKLPKEARETLKSLNTITWIIFNEFSTFRCDFADMKRRHEQEQQQEKEGVANA